MGEQKALTLLGIHYPSLGCKWVWVWVCVCVCECVCVFVFGRWLAQSSLSWDVFPSNPRGARLKECRQQNT